MRERGILGRGPSQSLAICEVQADGLDEGGDARDLLQVKSGCKVQGRRAG